MRDFSDVKSIFNWKPQYTEQFKKIVSQSDKFRSSQA